MEPFFEDDEQINQAVDPNWSIETLLAQPGIFYFKDVAEILKLSSRSMQREAKKLEDGGQDPYLVMGLRKVWSHWMIRMTQFAPYYRSHLQARFAKLPEDCDLSWLLGRKETYRLSDVCLILPVQAHRLKYQAQSLPDSRGTMGVYRDAALRIYLVEMAVFSVWIEQSGLLRAMETPPKKSPNPSV